ncbi:MAG: ribosome maturation factor RimP [Minwuiales bacterium]|nr:ribosome maturation factor RimP [Minwuiales bacterium]
MPLGNVAPIDRVADLIEPSLTALGYALVRVRFTGGDKAVLQVMAERIDDAQMDVEDCAQISRVLSALLDVEDPIPGAYTLEVSSPGIDRPLVKRGDFERFAGFEAKVELAAAQDGRRRFRGELLGVDDDRVRLRLKGAEGSVAALPLADIADAKLVLTDELIEASLKKSKDMTGAR